MEYEKPKNKNDEQPTPWNPSLLLASMFFLTNIVASILLGINWRRLGRPQWTMPTIAIPIGLLVLAGIGFGGLIAADGSQALFVVVFAPVAALFGFLLAVVQMQLGSYKVWKDKGDLDAVYAYEYNMRNAAFTLVGFTIVMIAVIGLAASS